MGHIHTFWRSRSNKTRMKESSDWRIGFNRLDPFIKRKVWGNRFNSMRVFWNFGN